VVTVVTVTVSTKNGSHFYAPFLDLIRYFVMIRNDTFHDYDYTLFFPNDGINYSI
jgi:hypothetical protein